MKVEYGEHVSYGNGGSTPKGKMFGITMPLVGHKTHAARREMERHAALEDASRILDTYLREVRGVVHEPHCHLYLGLDCSWRQPKRKAASFVCGP